MQSIVLARRAFSGQVKAMTIKEGSRPSVSRRARSETLSLRLDPKLRFAVEFIARLRGQTITTAVERAIKDAADSAVIGEPGLERS
jgi:predicted HicB family RNase H-like nuclease